MDTEIQTWLTDQSHEEIQGKDYWNNEDKEKKKVWYIVDGNTEKLLNYLEKKTTYLKEYQSVINYAEMMGLRIEGIGVDIAAGTCWVSSLLSRIEKVETIYAVEISKHRLLKLAPAIFELFGANIQKIVRVVGDFYNIKLPDKSVNFCFMSQAFPHADNPDRLLSEVGRVLKPSGFICITGETPILFYDIFNRYFKNIIKIVIPFYKFKTKPVYKLFPSFKDLFPVDKEKGYKHNYRTKDYFRIFEQNGFRLYRNKEAHFTNFIAVKE